MSSFGQLCLNVSAHETQVLKTLSQVFCNILKYVRVLDCIKTMLVVQVKIVYSYYLMERVTPIFHSPGLSLRAGPEDFPWVLQV